MSRKLNVYLHQAYIGELLQDDSGQMLFTYVKDWLDNPKAMALSHSLPLRTETFTSRECRGFFSGVLPEDEKREIIASILGISSRNDFALLERIGGECAGAVTFLPVGETPLKTDYRYRPLLTNHELADILRILPRRPLMAGDEGVRLSLAGAQDKIAVMIKDDKLFIPLGSAPSSHILKPAIDRFKGLVYNEALCLQLATAIAIPTAKTSIHSVENIDYLMIERYDRIIDGNGIIQRVHQEDFCQALGVVPEMKYQNERGPSLKQCFDLVRVTSSVPVLDLKGLLDAVIFNFLIGNHDAHGKNFSLLYHDRYVRLAPLYDIVCTSYYPELSQNMVMKIGGKYKSDEVLPRHFELLAKEIGFAVPMVCERVPELAGETIKAIDGLKLSNTTSRDVMTIIYNRCMKVKSLFG